MKPTILPTNKIEHLFSPFSRQGKSIVIVLVLLLILLIIFISTQKVVASAQILSANQVNLVNTLTPITANILPQNELTKTAESIIRAKNSASTPTIISSQTITPTSQPTLDYEALISHFEKVSSSTLDIAKWVVIIVATLGTGGGLLGAYSILSNNNEISKLQNEITTLESRANDLSTKLANDGKKYENSLNRFKYIMELRNPNPDLRLRAVQQIGESNDLIAVSALIDVIHNDKNGNVLQEAIFNMTKLILTDCEKETLNNALMALEFATRDADYKVRQEAVEALHKVICKPIQLPRSVIQRLREIPDVDQVKSVVDAAKLANERLIKFEERIPQRNN